MLLRAENLPRASRWAVLLFTWVGLGATVLYTFKIYLAGRIMLDTAFVAFLLMVFLPLAFLMFPAIKRAPPNKLPWYDIVLAALSVAGPGFIFFFALQLTESLWPTRPPLIPMVLGIITWGLVLEASRRVVGLPFFIIASLLSVYPLFASYMPSILFAKSYSLQRLTGFHFLGAASLFGIPMQIFGSMLIGFMTFGIALEATGASKFLFNLAQGLLGKARGGPALVAVLASAFLASLSGSSVANVISTGTVTIPAMKRLGIKPYVAGAIESVASNGGQLTPPVMGATAFVMAGFLRVPYAAVCIAAALPMIIYYVGLFLQVSLHCERLQLRRLEDSEIPSVIRTLKEGWFYLGSVVVLVYLLFWIRVEAWAPYYATVFLFLCALFRKETRPHRGTFFEFTMGIAKMLVFLAPVMAAVGLIMGSLTLTGVATSLAGELIVLAQNNLYLILLMGALGSFILGMGMTSTPCYIFMALIFAPSLVNLGVYPLAAHLFFLYWGMLSFITPPVCTAVYPAAALAGSSVMQTGFQAVRLAIIIYIVPFVFVLNPALIAYGEITQIIWSVTTAIIGAVFIAAGMEGYIYKVGTIIPLSRGLLLINGLVLLFGPVFFSPVQVVGMAISLLALAAAPVMFKRRQLAKISA